MSENKEKPAKNGANWISTLVDYGPLLVFLIAYWRFSPGEDGDGIGIILAVVRSTVAFVIAALIALAISKFLLGKVSRMLWLSTILIVGFGGLTIFLRDPLYVQIKPTVLYAFFGSVLLIGWIRGKALLQWLLEAAFEGLSDEGWLKLSRNWAFFFFALAALNEGLRFYLDFGDWLAAKLWVFMPLSFLFTFSQIPMLLRHGLDVEAKEEVIADKPPTGE